MPLPFSDLKEHDGKAGAAFNMEVTRLREIIKTPGQHVLALDCHGSITNRKMPEISEEPYRQIVDLYHEFSALGAEVVISSVWPVMLEVLQSLRAAGIEHTEEVLTQIVFEERTKTKYTITCWQRTSARQEPNFESIFANKLEAAVWYARLQGMVDISSLTILDDQDSNIRTFMSGRGETFGVRYSVPQVILVPLYAALNPEQ